MKRSRARALEPWTSGRPPKPQPRTTAQLIQTPRPPVTLPGDNPIIPPAWDPPKVPRRKRRFPLLWVLAVPCILFPVLTISGRISAAQMSEIMPYLIPPCVICLIGWLVRAGLDASHAQRYNRMWGADVARRGGPYVLVTWLLVLGCVVAVLWLAWSGYTA